MQISKFPASAGHCSLKYYVHFVHHVISDIYVLLSWKVAKQLPVATPVKRGFNLQILININSA